MAKSRNASGADPTISPVRQPAFLAATAVALVAVAVVVLRISSYEEPAANAPAPAQVQAHHDR